MRLRSVVEAADPEAVRAALRGPMGAGVAADRLTEALGVLLPILRPRVTASAVGRLVKAGFLVYLGGDPAFPEVHPDQVAALARRRDLPALLDRHVPLGPDQAAARLGVRRTDFDHLWRRAAGWRRTATTLNHGEVRRPQVVLRMAEARPAALIKIIPGIAAGRGRDRPQAPVAGVRGAVAFRR
ncbi:hypothetical protein [Streptomyces xanthophaeus]|uniref:hypothetical protein n=1 Tax=Streptomyces xanthophaeus TaxID=67385 RepID=UPI00233F6861|nr:hypothetical protein [Streptomyces xanthophaeus]